MMRRSALGDEVVFFFFNDTATTEIYTLSLHDALPILTTQAVDTTPTVSERWRGGEVSGQSAETEQTRVHPAVAVTAAYGWRLDRKSTRLDSRHANISYALFCFEKKNRLDM